MTIEIPLTKDKITIVDSCDADLANLKWYYHSSRGKTHKIRRKRTGYASRQITIEKGKQSTILLHRIILERVLGRRLTYDEQCDHINQNKLDNRRCNLRVASRSNNKSNTPKQCNNNSGYKGVYARGKKYQAQITVHKKKKHIGTFHTLEAAARAYDIAAIEAFGEFASTNFPREEYEKG